MDFNSFFAEQGSVLLRYATMVTADPHAAQDAVQTSLERAYQRWDRIGGLDRPDLYVRRMVINECLGQGRRNRRVTVTDAPPERTVPGNVADDVALRELLPGGLRHLPPQERAVIVLRHWGGMTDDQIADELGCRTTTVRGYHFRAIRRLRESLDPDLLPAPRSNGSTA